MARGYGPPSEGYGLRHLLSYQVNLAEQVVHLLIAATAGGTMRDLDSFKDARLLYFSFLLLQLLRIFVEFCLL